MKETLEKIHEMIERDGEKKIVIIGYSLGGWGATVLANYLKNGYEDGPENVPKLDHLGVGETEMHLLREIDAWCFKRNNTGKSMNWHFTCEDARIKLIQLYPKLNQ